jgi:hypothetical protein
MLTANLKSKQRGAGALAVAMLLLFSTSIVIFYLNRSLIFEQKAAANQVRSGIAFEMAEAGLEWATGMMNRQTAAVSTTCGTAASGNTFRRKYIQSDASTSAYVPTTVVFPGCKVLGANTAAATYTCSCPDIPASGTATAALGTTVEPGFTVAFAPVTHPTTGVVDSEAVRVTATGCTAQAGACTPATSGASDATATVTAILKLNPAIRAAPAAALTCGTSCQVGGSFDIVNRDVNTNGILVNAGTTITSGSGTGYQTIAGQPVANAMLPADPSLSSIASSDPTCTNSAMFQTYFGMTMAQYAMPPTTTIDCDNASSCGAALHAAYQSGARNFYFPSGLALNNSAPFSSLGSATDGVTIVSPTTIDINGNINLYGLVFSNSSVFNDLGTGTANIYGAMVTCAAHRNNGNGLLTYDAGALTSARRSSGALVRVPGSWRDF